MSEVATTGAHPIISDTPIGDRMESGGIKIPPQVPSVPEKIAEDELDRMDQLQEWWSAEAQRDADECLRKLIEYGSSDFDIMAHSMLAVGGKIWEGVPDAERMRVGREMAIAFYLQGKVARAFGAFEHGRMPSADTIDDIVRYGMMWKRVRQTGAWS